MAAETLQLDYGRGRSRRRMSRWAAVSLVLALLLWGLAAVTWGIYRDKPPPNSGFAGVGWSIVFHGFFGMLIVATWALAPASVLFGVAGWVAAARNPERMRGRWTAVAAITLAMALFAVVRVAEAWTKRPRPIVGAAFAPSPYPAHAESAAVSELVSACRRYAWQNGGKYPPDADTLNGWASMRPGEPLPYLADHVYCGGGLADDEVGLPYDPQRDADNNRLILFVRRRPVSGQWIIGVKGSPYRSAATVLPEAQLDAFLAECNDVRAKYNLPPLDFAALLGRAPAPAAAPASQPASQPAAPQL